MKPVVKSSWWLAGLLLQACGGSPIYFAAPIDGKVVDAETSLPIEGVVVVANWQLVTGSLDGTRDRGQLEVLETVTDEEGRFHFDGFWKLNPLMYELHNEDPRVLIFKGGYQLKKILNNYPGAGTETPGSSRTAAVNGMTVKLDKLKASELPPHYRRRLRFHFAVSTELSHLTESIFQCPWKKIPRMLLALEREKERLETQYPDAWIDIAGISNIQEGWLCGSAAEFFEGRRPPGFE